VTGVGLVPERFVARTDAAANVAWLRREQLPCDCLHDLRVALGREDHGDLWPDSDPEEPRYTTRARRSARFLDSVQRVSSVPPPSARGLRAVLLVRAPSPPSQGPAAVLQVGR
jgi:hypothetical protein